MPTQSAFIRRSMGCRMRERASQVRGNCAPQHPRWGTGSLSVPYGPAVAPCFQATVRTGPITVSRCQGGKEGWQLSVWLAPRVGEPCPIARKFYRHFA